MRYVMMMGIAVLLLGCGENVNQILDQFGGEPVQELVSPTGVFAVGGEVYHSDGHTPAPDGLTVRVLNRGTGKTAEALTGGTIGEGRYTVTYLDFTTNRAAQVGDVLEVSVWQGEEQVSTNITHLVTKDEILTGYALVNVVMK